jgi:T3SS negative regulator,GrlR
MVMSLEGLYVVTFGGVTGSRSNGGVVVLHGGRFFGGDSSYYYVGDYDTSAIPTVAGRGRIVKHSATAPNVFGDSAPEFEIVLRGRIGSGGVIRGTMSRSVNPNVALPFVLELKERLP